MTVNEFRDLIFENCYKRIGSARQNIYYSMKHQKKKYLHLLATKLTEKIPDPSNAKEYYNKKKKRKIN